MLKESK